MRRIVVNLLRQIGYTDVAEAADGTTALQKLREASFRLVICDWNMELMNGLQLLQAIRAYQKLTRLPFIMVTSESSHKQRVAAKNVGVNNYIVKPFNAETLRNKINSVV